MRTLGNTGILLRIGAVFNASFNLVSCASMNVPCDVSQQACEQCMSLDVTNILYPMQHLTFKWSYFHAHGKILLTWETQRQTMDLHSSGWSP